MKKVEREERKLKEGKGLEREKEKEPDSSYESDTVCNEMRQKRK